MVIPRHDGHRVGGDLVGGEHKTRSEREGGAVREVTVASSGTRGRTAEGVEDRRGVHEGPCVGEPGILEPSDEGDLFVWRAPAEVGREETVEEEGGDGVVEVCAPADGVGEAVRFGKDEEAVEVEVEILPKGRYCLCHQRGDEVVHVVEDIVRPEEVLEVVCGALGCFAVAVCAETLSYRRA